MSTRQHFEEEFPGCTSISRIENDRQVKRQIGREIHHLNRTYSAIDNKQIYIRVGDEYEQCAAKPVIEGKVHVFVSSKQRRKEIDLNKLRDEGFLWIYDLGDRLWSGREIRKRLRAKIADHRKDRKRLHRRIGQMEFNWSLFGLAITEAEKMHAESIGLSLTDVLLDSDPAFPSNHKWKVVGF